jgi:acyl-CoA thioester hydrolase
MARIEVELPGNFNFTTEISVRISDINYGGHVGNDTVLTLAHEARVRFLNKAGYGELNIEGTGIIISDAAVEYKSELFYGDNVIISIKALNFTKHGFDLFYKMEKNSKNDNPDDRVRQANILVAKIKTGVLCYDYSKKKIAPLPENAAKKIAEL